MRVALGPSSPRNMYDLWRFRARVQQHNGCGSMLRILISLPERAEKNKFARRPFFRRALSPSKQLERGRRVFRIYRIVVFAMDKVKRMRTEKNGKKTQRREFHIRSRDNANHTRNEQKI